MDPPRTQLKTPWKNTGNTALNGLSGIDERCLSEAVRMKEDPNAMMFRQLPPWLQDILRELSRDGYIYIGRTGPGLTYKFRRACMQEGTLRAINMHMQYHDLEYQLLVELIATEGPRWVPYRRILEYCQSGVYQILRQKHSP